MSSKFDARQIISRDTLNQLASSRNKELDDLLRSINSEMALPLRLMPDASSGLVINVENSTLSNPEHGRKRRIPLIGSKDVKFQGGTVTLPASSGGLALASPGNSITIEVADGKHKALLISLNSLGQLFLSAGPEADTASEAEAPSASTSMYHIGYVVVTSSGGAIQSITDASIYQFMGGGVGGDGQEVLVKGGTWTFTNPDTLSWSENAYVDLLGIERTRNSITAGSVQLQEEGSVAYVKLNKTPGAAAALSVHVAASILETPQDSDVFVLARKDIDSVVLADGSRLVSGENKKLGATLSDELLTYIGADNAAQSQPDYGNVPYRFINSEASLKQNIATVDEELAKALGQHRISEHATDKTRVVIAGSDFLMKSGNLLGQTINNLQAKFDGAQIDFATGQIYDAEGTSLVGSFDVDNVDGQYRWYSLTLTAGDVTVDNRVQLIPAITAGESANANKADAARATYLVGLKVGQVAVKGTAATVEDITYSDIVQLGAGSGSGEQPAVFESAASRTSGNQFTALTNSPFTAEVADATGIIRGATVTFLTGNNAGFSSSVDNVDNNSELALRPAPPYDISAGDTFRVTPYTGPYSKAINSSAPTVVGGKTRWQLGFEYPVDTAYGRTVQELTVRVDGVTVPRKDTTGTVVQNCWWQPVTGTANTIELDRDYSVDDLYIEAELSHKTVQIPTNQLIESIQTQLESTKTELEYLQDSTLNGVQTLFNKTLVEPVLDSSTLHNYIQIIDANEDSGTPPTPQTYGINLYQQEDRLFAKRSSGGTFEITSSERKNYAPYGDSESSRFSLATYSDGAAQPIDGEGGTFSGLSKTTSTPLSGVSNYKFTPSSTLGSGVSFTFTPENKDTSFNNDAVFEIILDYEIQSFTNYQTGDLQIWVLGFDNSEWTPIINQPTNFQVPKKVGPSRMVATFKPTPLLQSGYSQYRVCLHQATNNTAWIACEFEISCYAQNRYPSATAISLTSSGTAAAPAITLNNSNTGLFAPAFETIGVSTGGVERLRVSSSGQLSTVVAGGSTLYNGYVARAWVSFNGRNIVGTNSTIFASGGVTSVTKNATGDYTVNFSTAFPDTSYAWAFSCNGAGPGAQIVAQLSGTSTSATLFSTTQIRFNTTSGTTSAVNNTDVGNASAVFFR